MSSSSTYFSPSPLKKRVSAMVRWGERGRGEGGGVGVVMVVLSGILKFHLYTLLDFSTIRGKCNSISFMDHKHASFQTVVNSSSQIYKKLSTLIWCNFTVIQFLLPEVLINYFYFSYLLLH